MGTDVWGWGVSEPDALSFRKIQAEFTSGSQKARVWTEEWLLRSTYCPSCGENQLEDFPNNKPVADFYCSNCTEEFELKSSKNKFGKSVPDGAYKTMTERLRSETNPSLMLLQYDIKQFGVTDLSVIPKQFFVPEIIKKRKPLSDNARRAGWVGCDIIIDKVPSIGRVKLISNRSFVAKEYVLENWQRSAFLKAKPIEAKGWLLDTIHCIERIGSTEFSLAEIYSFENYLSELHPENYHIKDKLRQQLQILRDAGYLEFQGRGQYRLK